MDRETINAFRRREPQKVKLTTTYPGGGRLHRDLYVSFAESYQGFCETKFDNVTGACLVKIPNDEEEPTSGTFSFDPERQARAWSSILK